MTVTHARPRLPLIAGVAATTLALSGCAGVVGATMTYHDTVSAKITEIVLTGGSGDVTVTAAPGTETTITRVVRRSSDPGETYKLVGSSLNIAATCGFNCSVSYEIKAPAGVPVRGRLDSGNVRLDAMGGTDLEVASGDVEVSNAAGPVQLRATSGNLTISDVKGPVKAQSTSGDVEARNVGGAVDLKVTSGNTTVALATPNSVTVRSTSGDIDVTVPRGSYRLAAETDSGDVDLGGLANDPAAKTVLDLRAGSGNVIVSPAT